MLCPVGNLSSSAINFNFPLIFTKMKNTKQEWSFFLLFTKHWARYPKVATSKASCLEALAGICRLLVKGIFYANVLWPFDNFFFIYLVMLVNTRDFTLICTKVKMRPHRKLFWPHCVVLWVLCIRDSRIEDERVTIVPRGATACAQVR